MLGCYDITVGNKDISFELHIERNITILRGMSGNGKSIFASMVEAYTRDGDTSGVTIDASVDVKRLTEKVQLYNGYAKGRTIFVIDEMDIILRDEGELKNIIETEDCYFIIITRNPLASLPYSVKSIYTFKQEDNTLSRNFCVNKLCNMYAESYSSLVPDILYTEDEKAGFQFTKS